MDYALSANAIVQFIAAGDNGPLFRHVTPAVCNVG